VPDPSHPFAERSPFWLALFRVWLHFLFWRRFSAVRLSRGGIPDRHAGRPLVVYTNHPSWWDPALMMLASPKLFPNRIGFGPMDAAQLRRYGLFRKFGVFGVEPGLAGAKQFLRTARSGLAEPRAIMWITAEGQFADPRTRPVVLRQGIAHLARLLPNAVLLPAALDYPFWNESRPEALLRFGPPILLAGAKVADAHAALTAALTETMDALAADAATRDPGHFVTLLNGTAGTGLIYDSWRRLLAWARGQRFTARHETEPP
jgi:1-acyl-sn-glycerol-3-phosphate acyltransferase